MPARIHYFKGKLVGQLIIYDSETITKLTIFNQYFSSQFIEIEVQTNLKKEKWLKKREFHDFIAVIKNQEIKNGKTFFTDSNGFFILEREIWMQKSGNE